MNIVYLCNSDLLRFTQVDCGSVGLEDNIRYQSHRRNQDDAGPEDGAREEHLEHVDHVGAEGDDGPGVTDNEAVDEPEDDAAPDAGVTWPVPGVHLQSCLETSRNHDRTVDGVSKMQVSVSFPTTPLHSSREHVHGHPVQDDGVVESQTDPLPKLQDVEDFSVLRLVIQTWIFLSDFCRTRSVKQSQCHGGCGGEEKIVHANGPSFIDNLSTPIVVESKPKLNDIQSNILVEAVKDDFADSTVVPGAVNKQQS